MSAEAGLLHPRNQHHGRYDFAHLTRIDPALAPFVRPSPRGEDSIDFADPLAVLALNRALLHACYGVTHWDLPAGFLCPPIPGRADHVHHAADLLAADCDGNVPRGPDVAVLDVGVGANCIYPIVGRHEYGWSFVGTECDPLAARAAESLIAANALLRERVVCRVQHHANALFRGVVEPGDRFALSLCNPPFHPSAAAAAAATQSKQRKLARSDRAVPLQRNFGGRPHELWCDGGEVGFVRRMIAESREFAAQCVWFSSLVASRDSLPALERELARTRVHESRIVPIAHGQKRSRLLAWTFQPAPERRAQLQRLSRA